METQNVTRLLDAALDRWEHKGGERGEAVDASLRHIEVFAYASIARELREIRLTLQARHEEAIDRAENIAQRRRAEGAETSAHRAPESHEVHAEPAPRQHDTPCFAQHEPHPGQPRRCTRRTGHVGEHVDAAGRRWGDETDA